MQQIMTINLLTPRNCSGQEDKIKNEQKLISPQALTLEGEVQMIIKYTKLWWVLSKRKIEQGGWTTIGKRSLLYIGFIKTISLITWPLCRDVKDDKISGERKSWCKGHESRASLAKFLVKLEDGLARSKQGLYSRRQNSRGNW